MKKCKEVFSISKTGKLLVWYAELLDEKNIDGFYQLEITSGTIDGKKTNKIRHVKKGMNIGKSNETTHHGQAFIELNRLYKKQYDKGYKDDINDVCIEKQVDDGIRKPTLAEKYNPKKPPENKDDIITQPKIDGVRCFITKLLCESIQFTSRSGKPLPPIKIIADAIRNDLPVGDIIDGEIYIDDYELQDIISVVTPTKNKKDDEVHKLKLYWYDYIPKDKEHLSYKERFLDNELSFNDTSIVDGFESNIIRKIESESFNLDTFEYTFDKYISNGFEGLMLRDIKAPYLFGQRVKSLLKYKKMLTDEFQIVDIIESVQDKTPRFICDLRNGNTVTVRLKGDKIKNMGYLNDKESHIGSWLTISFQKWTVTNSLQFPVGINIRSGSVVDGEFIPDI